MEKERLDSDHFAPGEPPRDVPEDGIFSPVVREVLEQFDDGELRHRLRDRLTALLQCKEDLPHQAG